MNSAPEAPLWALLDQIGLPFRVALGDLVARFGTAPCVWMPDLPLCALPARPLLAGVSPFTAQIMRGGDSTLPAFHLSAHYRAHSAKTLADKLTDRRTERNVADVVAALTGLLGPGTDCAASNTLGCEWRFGAARLRVIGFPPRLNSLPNSRHDSDPGSQTEAHITLQPGWMPPLSPAERVWLQDVRPLIAQSASSGAIALAPPWRRLPADLPLAPGIGLAGQGAALVVGMAGFFQLLPRAHLQGLLCGLARPARGGGYAVLEVLHAPPDLPDVRPHRLQVMSASYSDTALAREADILAQALGLTCRVERYLDD